MSNKTTTTSIPTAVKAYLQSVSPLPPRFRPPPCSTQPPCIRPRRYNREKQYIARNKKIPTTAVQINQIKTIPGGLPLEFLPPFLLLPTLLLPRSIPPLPPLLLLLLPPPNAALAVESWLPSHRRGWGEAAVSSLAANTRDDSLLLLLLLWLPLGACTGTPPLPTAAAAVPLVAVGGGQDCFDKLLALLCLSGERYTRSSWEPLL